jgi:hypothetical protein
VNRNGHEWWNVSRFIADLSSGASNGSSGRTAGWRVGLVDWDDLAEFVRNSYRLIAPKRLSASLDSAHKPKD